MIINIKKLSPYAVTPVRATNGSAGYDLSAAVAEPVIIGPGERVLIPCGFSVEIPVGYAAFVFARSGLASRHGIALSNGVGVVDSDYRGEVRAALCNLSAETYNLQPGERIAQMVIIPVCCPEVVETEELTETQRGSGGFGSTGV